MRKIERIVYIKVTGNTMSYVEFTKIVNEYKKNTPQANADLDDLIPAIQAAYGISKSDFTNYELELLEAALQRTYDTAKHTGQEYILYGGYEPVTVTLCHIVNHRAGLSFTSYSHTGLPVPVYAIGAGAELFDGFYDNTDVYYKLAAITKTSKAKKAA
ncbi:MAG: alkaline phosphatase [Bacillota bacterium]